MNELINGNAIKMTSIEIAELVGKRHDNVKRTSKRWLKMVLSGFLKLRIVEESMG